MRQIARQTSTVEQLARVDFDGDLDVDLADFGAFQIVFTGSGK